MAIYATVSELKVYRGIAATSTKDDDLLRACLNRAQKAVESYAGRVFVAPTTAATRYFDAIENISYNGRTLYLDDDLASITSITNGDDETVESTDYVTEPRNSAPYHAITIKSGASSTWTYSDSPENAIEVNGRWGYATSAPEDIKHAVIRLAAFYYAQKDSSVFDVTVFPDAGVMTTPQGMPADVKLILEPYRRLR